MNSSIWYFMFSLIINVSVTKNLHLKENILAKDKGGKTLMSLQSFKETKHERFARHIETETENVLAIFLKKIGNVYPAMEKQRRGVFLNKVMKTLKKKMTAQVAPTTPPIITTTSGEESSEEDDSSE